MHIDTMAHGLYYKKGLLRVNQYKNFSEVRCLEFITYDVPASASPFKKTNREFIAEIRLILDKGIPLDIFHFEKYSKDELDFARVIFDETVKFTGFESRTRNNNETLS